MYFDTWALPGPKEVSSQAQGDLRTCSYDSVKTMAISQSQNSMNTHGETGRGGWSCQPIQTDHTTRRGAGLPGQMVHMAACRELNFCQKLGVEYLSLLILHKSCPYYYTPCSIDVICRLNTQIHQYLSIVYFCFMQCSFFVQMPTVKHIKTRYFGIQKNIVS